jgi:hypothetical protein
MSNEDIWLKLLDRKNMHCFRIYSPVDKNTDIPFLFKAMNPLTGKGLVTDLKGEKLSPLALKSRYKEIGVGERYLEKFVRDLM